MVILIYSCRTDIGACLVCSVPAEACAIPYLVIAYATTQREAFSSLLTVTAIRAHVVTVEQECETLLSPHVQEVSATQSFAADMACVGESRKDVTLFVLQYS